jgi:hypothetical protein
MNEASTYLASTISHNDFNTAWVYLFKLRFTKDRSSGRATHEPIGVEAFTAVRRSMHRKAFGRSRRNTRASKTSMRCDMLSSSKTCTEQFHTRTYLVMLMGAKRNRQALRTAQLAVAVLRSVLRLLAEQRSRSWLRTSLFKALVVSAGTEITCRSLLPDSGFSFFYFYFKSATFNLSNV